MLQVRCGRTRGDELSGYLFYGGSTKYLRNRNDSPEQILKDVINFPPLDKEDKSIKWISYADTLKKSVSSNQILNSSTVKRTSKDSVFNLRFGITQEDFYYSRRTLITQDDILSFVGNNKKECDNGSGAAYGYSA